MAEWMPGAIHQSREWTWEEIQQHSICSDCLCVVPFIWAPGEREKALAERRLLRGSVR